jgi:hypothetical protein
VETTLAELTTTVVFSILSYHLLPKLRAAITESHVVS